MMGVLFTRKSSQWDLVHYLVWVVVLVFLYFFLRMIFQEGDMQDVRDDGRPMVLFPHN